MGNLLITTYIVLDAAKMYGAIGKARELNPKNICLYQGESKRSLGAVGPWLFEFQQNSAFSQWIFDNARGNNWGVIFHSKADFQKIFRHLRKFLIVSTEDGRELYFRFYDPRVLSMFLPTCNQEQLQAFFGPVEAFFAEGDSGLLVKFSFSGGKLYSEELDADFIPQILAF